MTKENQNYLTFIEDLGYIYPNLNSKQKRRYALVKCICDKEFKTSSYSFFKNKIKSCGCKSNEIISKANSRHGSTRTRLYKTWTGMFQRTINRNNNDYKNYGEKGIVVCNEWKDFIVFKEWALNNGYEEHLTIDRINNDGNYEPNNCRWVNRTVQNRNKRKIQRNNKTGYLGVSIDNQIKNAKYRAVIRINKINHHIGFFETAEEAAKARDNYIIQHGLNHTKNFD